MNNNWTNRIKEWSITPPDKAWEKIVAALDESNTPHNFAEKLYELEIDPPAAAWEKIHSTLEEDQPRSIAPFKSTGGFRPVLRFALAAALVGVIVFGVLKITTKNTTKNDLTQSAQPFPGNDFAQKQNTNRSTNLSDSISEQNNRDEAELEASKHTYAKLDLPRRTIANKPSFSLYNMPAAVTDIFPDDEINQDNLELQYPHRAAVSDPSSKTPADRYMMFRDADGRYIRISKKLSDLLCCVTGEETNEDCSSQLKKWRAEIATAAFVPAPDNFMDILDLLKSLQDNHN